MGKSMPPLYLGDVKVYFRKRPKVSPFIYFSIDSGKTWKTTKQQTTKQARDWVLANLGYKKQSIGVPTSATLGRYAPNILNEHFTYKKNRGEDSDPGHEKDCNSWLNRFILTDVIADLPITKINRGNIEDFQNRLIKSMPDKLPTVVKVMVVLKLIMKRAYERGDIDKNPTLGVKSVKVKKRERSLYKRDDLDTLFPKSVWEDGAFLPWDDPYDYTAFIIAATTGMRRGEVLALEWSAIDLQNKTIEIKKALKDDGSIGKPKAGRPRYTLIFDSVFWEDQRAVKAIMNLNKKQQLEKIATIHLFGYPDGTLRKGTWWNKHLRKALDRAGIDRGRDGPLKLPLDAHSFRHTLASNLKGIISDDLIRLFCGWTDNNMQQNYTRLETEQLQRILKQVKSATF
jgi:integrase